MPKLSVVSLLHRRRSLFILIILCFIATLLRYASLELHAPFIHLAPIDEAQHDSSFELGFDPPVIQSDVEPEQVQHEEEPSDTPVLSLSPKFCKPEECSQGTWVPRDPPLTTLSDLQKIYPPSHRGSFRMCGGEGNDREDRVEYHKSQEQRFMNVMNWLWKPEKGSMLEWDADKFVVRLLQSPGGLVLSGDSITRQQFEHIEYALARAGVSIWEDPDHLPKYNHNRLHQFLLKPGDEKTNYLRELAGVPESRLLRPIYTKMDNHAFIGEKDVREITEKLGAKEGFEWYDIFDYFEDWEKFLEDMAKTREGEEETVKEDTVLILNTGAHWSRGTLYMIPKDGTIREQQELVAKTHAEMINRVTSRLAPIEQLSVFYRATGAAHPGCSPKTQPYTNITQAIEAEGDMYEAMGKFTTKPVMAEVVQRWDWDQFDTHNRLWESKFAELSKQRKATGKGPKWHFMDVWNMTLMRPDAHTQTTDGSHGNYDCLHWCVPGVVEQWTRLLYHWVFWTLEMENEIDY